MYDQGKTGDNCEFYYGQGMFHHLKANGPGAGSSWVVARMKVCGDGDWVDGESGRRPSSSYGGAPHVCADVRLCRSLRRVFGSLPYSDGLKEC